ncbi:MAG: hypothetical protein BWY90_01197 [Deltaproteobacteria bacterium ADurb.BinA014]|nr:MAG: hypothetical protein BWY90_01197 [Deltaproteobacteria bacterium ADurb.BinA014]
MMATGVVERIRLTQIAAHKRKARSISFFLPILSDSFPMGREKIAAVTVMMR